MTEHYYSHQPAATHKPGEIKETVRGRLLTFATDAGVFSKGGIDYGSRLLIETVQLEPGMSVLDVGCGYGPIGLYSALQTAPGIVTMIDVNERALELAKKNAELNKINNVEIVKSNLFEALQGRLFDCIVTNPPIRAGKDIVHGIFEQAHQHLIPGGQLWVVIQKKQGAPSAYTKLESLYESVAEISKSKGYHIFKAVKILR